MRAAAKTLAVLGGLTIAHAASAEEPAVIEGLPAGVMILDATPEPSAAIETVPATEPLATAVEPAAPVPVTQSQASVRSPEPLEFETLGGAAATAAVPPVDLAPGETILETIVVPSIVRVPEVQPVFLLGAADLTEPEHAAPAPKVDPVTGRLRDTPGWTGRTDGAASIGCFPAGACASLNAN